MFFKTLLSTIFLALTVVANPVVLHKSPVSLQLTRKINAAGGTRNIVALDRARAAALKSRVSGQKASGSASVDSVNQPVDNRAGSYFASVDVGNPGTTCEFTRTSLRNYTYLSSFQTNSSLTQEGMHPLRILAACRS